MSEDGPAGDALALDLATRCALARLSEIDNIHLASMTTPGGIVIPAALTLAAATPAATADDVTAAILAGTEAMIRLGRAVDGPAILYRGIWPTYFAAPFARRRRRRAAPQARRSRPPPMRWRSRSRSRRPASGITTRRRPRAGLRSARPPAMD